MIHNDYMPKIEVDPETYQVKADGKLSRASRQGAAMAQRYFLF